MDCEKTTHDIYNNSISITKQYKQRTFMDWLELWDVLIINDINSTELK